MKRRRKKKQGKGIQPDGYWACMSICQNIVKMHFYLANKESFNLINQLNY
jgi:hypothetical protein